MTMLEQLEADVANVEPDMPVTFIFNGKPYTGQRDQSNVSQDFVDAGIIPKCDFPLLARNSIFPPAPAPVENDEIEIDSAIYRVNSLRESQDGIATVYALVLRT